MSSYSIKRNDKGYGLVEEASGIQIELGLPMIKVEKLAKLLKTQRTGFDGWTPPFFAKTCHEYTGAK